MGIRKNQKALTAAEWKAFIDAVDAMHGTGAAAPAYRSFVNLHVDAMSMAHMNWKVHSMQMGGMTMRGENFLTWHRRFVKLMEERLQKIKPGITIPSWDSITDRAIPAALNDAVLMSKWSVTRSWDATQLAKVVDLNAVKNYPGSFTGFQTLLEGAVHGGTHNAVGGNMAGSSSPTDPLFWLHHSFMDKLWADWQASLNGSNPPSPSRTLLPANMVPDVPFGVKVSSLLSISALGYSYA